MIDVINVDQNKKPPKWPKPTPSSQQNLQNQATIVIECLSNRSETFNPSLSSLI